MIAGGGIGGADLRITKFKKNNENSTWNNSYSTNNLVDSSKTLDRNGVSTSIKEKNTNKSSEFSRLIHTESQKGEKLEELIFSPKGF